MQKSQIYVPNILNHMRKIKKKFKKLMNKNLVTNFLKIIIKDIMNFKESLKS